MLRKYLFNLMFHPRVSFLVTVSSRCFAAFLIFFVSMPVATDAADLPPTRTTLEIVRAAEAGNLNKIQGLLQAGADPNAVDVHWNSPLIFAARDGRFDMVKVLVRAGALIDWQDGEKVTLLILAAYRNHPEIARYLLELGADPWIVDKWGRRALDYALRRGKNDPIALLIRRAETNWPIEGGRPTRQR